MANKKENSQQKTVFLDHKNNTSLDSFTQTLFKMFVTFRSSVVKWFMSTPEVSNLKYFQMTHSYSHSSAFMASCSSSMLTILHRGMSDCKITAGIRLNKGLESLAWSQHGFWHLSSCRNWTFMKPLLWKLVELLALLTLRKGKFG